MSLPETRLKHRFSKINVHTLSGERVHSISQTLPSAQGGFLKKNAKAHFAIVVVFFCIPFAARLIAPSPTVL